MQLGGEVQASGVRLWLSGQELSGQVTGAAAHVEAEVFAVYGPQTALEAGLRALASVASRRALLPLEQSSAGESQVPLVYRVVGGQKGPEYRAERRGY